MGMLNYEDSNKWSVKTKLMMVIGVLMAVVFVVSNCYVSCREGPKRNYFSASLSIGQFTMISAEMSTDELSERQAKRRKIALPETSEETWPSCESDSSST